MKPLVIFDIESTGTNPATDRIVELSMIVGDNGKGMLDPVTYRFNPGVHMSDEVVKLHGITNEAVKNEPAFKVCAKQIHDVFNGATLVGFGLINFDVPILWEEFYRAGIKWDVAGVAMIDVGNIYKKLNPRTLTAAVAEYLGVDHAGAHGAKADAIATGNVLRAMRKKHAEITSMTQEQLAAYSRFDNRYDLAGKLLINEKGEVVYGFKQKGVPVRDDPGLAEWMLGKDFPVQTKMMIEGLLDKLDAERKVEAQQQGAVAAPESVHPITERDLPW